MKQCQHEEVYEDAHKHLKIKPCSNHPTGVWCKEHSYCAELLQVAEALDYPRYTIASLDNKPIYTLYGGKDSWQGYARRHPARRHQELVRRMRKELLRIV